MIELKAVGKDKAAMTAYQAQRAVEEKDHYALVVLVLEENGINEEAIINRARFVTNIGYVVERKYEEVVGMREKQDAVKVGTAD